MEEEALRIEYSDRNSFCHGHRQTNFIPGGPKPPIYDGMSAMEMAFAKSEFRKVRKKYTDGLRIKHLKENNEEYEPESFSGCLSLFLQPMADVQKGRLGVNHTFPDKKILLMRVAKEANLRGVNLFVRGVIFANTHIPVSDFVWKLITLNKMDGLSPLPMFANVINLVQQPHFTSSQDPRS
jgi:hypothetical protein